VKSSDELKSRTALWARQTSIVAARVALCGRTVSGLANYGLLFRGRARCRKRTPGPPPFSSIISIPLRLSAI
jgi:hypothetical protein